MRVLTVRQPWADLIMSGLKDVENRSWPVPSTLPQHWRCSGPGSLGMRIPPASFPDNERPDHGVDDGPFPFTLGIHAAKTVDRDAPLGELDDRRRRWLDEGNIPTEVVFAPRLGVLLGTVQVTGQHHADECERRVVVGGHRDGTYGYCSPWAEPYRFHWTLADPEPLDVPVPMKGRQGLWEVTGP